MGYKITFWSIGPDIHLGTSRADSFKALVRELKDGWEEHTPDPEDEHDNRPRIRYANIAQDGRHLGQVIFAPAAKDPKHIDIDAGLSDRKVRLDRSGEVTIA